MRGEGTTESSLKGTGVLQQVGRAGLGEEWKDPQLWGTVSSVQCWGRTQGTWTRQGIIPKLHPQPLMGGF